MTANLDGERILVVYRVDVRMLWGVVKLLGRGGEGERYSTTILPFPCQCD